jgi:hypothetical protein
MNRLLLNLHQSKLYIFILMPSEFIVIVLRYMVFTNEALRSEFLLHMDIWGDSYTKNINDRGLKEVSYI